MSEFIVNSLESRSFPPGNDWFIDFFWDSCNNSFIQTEGDYWDFKKDWPFSYSDAYFHSLAKHVTAFCNTKGGILIFGVDDETRKPQQGAVRINTDKFQLALKNILSDLPDLEFRNVQIGNSVTVYIIIIYPILFVTKPIQFKNDFCGKNDIAPFWIRSSFESIEARARHIPILFCGAGRTASHQHRLEATLPPNPANIKQFVARLEPVNSVFAWLTDVNEPRVFLYGRGGSGKTTIAYEIAKNVANYGSNIILSDGSQFDNVIFISAKEKSLATSFGTIEEFQGKDFSDINGLLSGIIQLGGWSNNLSDLEKMSKEQLVSEVQELFNFSSNFIIIDDIDTLTTKGIDAGFDELFKLSIRAKRATKILYTQRNAPTQSLSNSIEVPGLAKDTEYPRFVKVCSEHFKVPQPSNEFRDGLLADISERRPLIIETIIALRRSAGTYPIAIEVFERNVGEDARSYVFEREWSALTNPHSKHLLCALALISKPVSFDDLKIVLRIEVSNIIECINETREMFLELDDSGDETLYSVGSLTRSFISKKSKDLDRYASIDARVKSFRRTYFPEMPALSHLISRSDDLILRARNSGDSLYLDMAWTQMNSSDLEPKITEDPRFRAYRGYLGTQFKAPKYNNIREDFEYAFSMNFAPPEHHIRAWYLVEEKSAEAFRHCENIANLVIHSRGYTASIKLSYQSRKAGIYYLKGKELRYDNVVECFKCLESSLRMHASIFHKAFYSNDVNLYRYEGYFKNTALLLFNTANYYKEFDVMLDCLINISNEDSVIFDPFFPAIKEYMLTYHFENLSKSVKERFIGRSQFLKKKLGADKYWEDASSLNEFSQIVDALILKIRG